MSNGNMFDAAASAELERRNAPAAPKRAENKSKREPYDRTHTIIIGADDSLHEFMRFLRMKTGKTNTAILSYALAAAFSDCLEPFSLMVSPDAAARIESLVKDWE